MQHASCSIFFQTIAFMWISFISYSAMLRYNHFIVFWLKLYLNLSRWLPWRLLKIRYEQINSHLPFRNLRFFIKFFHCFIFYCNSIGWNMVPNKQHIFHTLRITTWGVWSSNFIDEDVYYDETTVGFTLLNYQNFISL